jgi:hypothetical protein
VKEGDDKKDGGITTEVILTQEATKMQLNDMFREIEAEFQQLKKKVGELVE